MHLQTHTTLLHSTFRLENLGTGLQFHASSAPLKEYYTPGQTMESGRKCTVYTVPSKPSWKQIIQVIKGFGATTFGREIK